MAVASGEAQAYDASILHDDPARPLDVQEKGVDGVVHPQDLQAAPSEGAGLDLGTALQGHELAAADAPGDVAALPIAAKTAEVDQHQIAGTAINGHLVRTVPAPRSPQFGLVIPGEQALRIAVAKHQVRREPGLEEMAGHGVRLLADALRRRARKLPVGGGAAGAGAI